MVDSVYLEAIMVLDVERKQSEVFAWSRKMETRRANGGAFAICRLISI